MRENRENMIVVGADTSRVGVFPELGHQYYDQLREADMATRRELDDLSAIKLSHDWDATTCAYTYLRDAIKLVGANFKNSNNPDIMLPIANVMTLGITYSQDDYSEKEGNINVMFYIGDLVEDIVAMRNVTYTSNKAPLLVPTDVYEDEYQLLKTLDAATRRDMGNEYNYIIGHEWFYTTVAAYYFKNLLRQLYIKFMETNMSSQSLNFFDLIEININPKYANEDDETDNTIIGKITIAPGVSAKLGVKDDKYTDPGEDDDSVY